MTDIAKRLREIAGDVLAINPREAKDSYAAQNIHARLGAIAAELESQPAGDPAMPDCWAILTPNGSRLVSEEEARGRKDAYPLYTHEAIAKLCVALIEAKAAIAAARQERVPDGWVLVPREPTPEMLAAAHDGDVAYTLRNFGDVMTVMQGPYDHWCAMIAAAPKPDTP